MSCFGLVTCFHLRLRPLARTAAAAAAAAGGGGAAGAGGGGDDDGNVGNDRGVIMTTPHT